MEALSPTTTTISAVQQVQQLCVWSIHKVGQGLVNIFLTKIIGSVTKIKLNQVSHIKHLLLNGKASSSEEIVVCLYQVRS